MFECAMASAVGLLGSPLRLEVLSHLAKNPRGFNQLCELLPQVDQQELKQTLLILEKENFVARKKGQYVLSEFGANMVPVLGLLAKWDEKNPVN